MNSQIRRVGLGLSLCFLALFAQLNWLQVFGASRLENNATNTRAIVRDFGRPRGTIATADGVIIARSIEVESALGRERQYPEGDLYAHVTGAFTFNFGATGVEKIYNELLAGQTDEQKYGNLSALLEDGETTGNLTLTLRDDVQRVAREALGDHNGSVVVLDPRDGSILAMWSYPSYDPNTVATVNLDAARTSWDTLRSQDPTAPDLAKAYRQTFPPGSTFKPVTAAAALSNDIADANNPSFPASSGYTAPLTTSSIGNFGGSTCGGDIAEGIRISCNTIFAELGAEYVGPVLMREQAENFGFNEAPPIDLTASVASVFPEDFGAHLRPSDKNPDISIVENTPALAQASIGQFEVRASPLQMALVAAAITNGGIIMEPHVLSEVRNVKGEQIEEYKPSVWKSAMVTSVAEAMRQMLLTTATNGTAVGLQVPGFEVGGKTGTAETFSTTNDTHAWIIGFGGPAGEASTVAIAVMVEAFPGGGQQTGGGTAAPIAQAVLAAALQPMTAQLGEG